MKKCIRSVMAAAVIATPALAQAMEINWNGFLSVAAGKTLDEEQVYTVEPTTGGAYDNELRFDPESVVGLQAQARLADDLRATVQLVSKGATDFDTKVDWAYLSYDLTNNLTLNAGRFRLPLYYYSDFIDVGYAYHWVRPPVELYNVFTANLEGVNLYHTKMIGSVELATQVWYGGIDTEQESVFGTSYFDTLGNTGINTLLTWEWLRLRLLYNVTDIALDSTFPDPMTGNDVATSSDIDATFLAAGVMIDYGNFILRSEMTQSERDTYNEASVFGPAGLEKSEERTWYASAGYRIGEFTPHFTRLEVDPRKGYLVAPTKTDTIGVAWNFHSSAVFKLEYLETEVEAGVFSPATEAKVISTAIDIIF